MASIRTRVTTAYALALGGTMLAFTGALWAARKDSVLRDVQLRVATLADIGHLVLTQAGTQNTPVVVTNDSLRGPELQPLVRARLDAVPEFLVVRDSLRTLYASVAVRNLENEDRAALVGSAARLTPERPVAIVQLTREKLLLVARFEHGEAGPVRRVVAASSVREAEFLGSEQFGVFLLTAPLALLLSVILAYLITGRAMRPVDVLIHDVSAITDGRSLHKRLPVARSDDELARLAETLNVMIARLEHSFTGLRRFTADASHELKTPLTVLRADIERAMTAGPSSVDGPVALEEALQETARMANLVESLLTLARSDEGRFDLHRELVPLEPLVREVAETAQILGEDSGLKVILAPVEAVTVMGDPLRLRQLFLNLVTNAVKYTGKGGRLDLSLVRRGDAVEFAVADTGIGIAGADLPYVFDRFWRADRARSRSQERSGVGLGLSISQWIAHAHGGSITVSSRLGRGSTFTVTLPMPGPEQEVAAGIS